MTETFCKLAHEIMRATCWISKTTGETFSLTGDQKVIWVWMVSRYDFFNSQGKGWFDNQDDIAEATGCSVSAVKRFIRMLTLHGYMLVESKKLRGSVHSNSYKIVAPLQLHSKHASVATPAQSLGVEEILVVASAGFASSAPPVAPQEAIEQLVPVFEDVPLEAHINNPRKAPVIVHETLRGFADTLDEEIKFDAPVLPKELSDSSSEPDLWG